MAVKTWEGRAPTVAQVTTVTVGGTISGETFTISAAHPSGSGGDPVQIASYVDTDTSATTVATNLKNQWNASNHPYARAVTAESSSGVITLTADTRGIPFILSLNTPGGSATLTQSTTTANSGPHDWKVPGNWIEGAIPATNDDVLIQGSSSILYGLATNVSDIDTITIKEFNGTIGTIGTPLEVGASDEWLIDSRGCSAFLKLSAGTTLFRVVSTATGHRAGVYADFPTGGGTVTSAIIDGGYVSFGDFADSDVTFTSILVRGGFFRTVSIGAAGLASTVTISGGTVELAHPNTSMSLITLAGGQLATYGTLGATTVTVDGGTLISNATGTIGTLNAYAGLADFSKSRAARTVTTTNLHQKCVLRRNKNVITMTTVNEFGAFELRGIGEAA